MTNLPAAAPAPLPGFVPRDRTLLMGVLNVTPDSFSDGGRWADPEAAGIDQEFTEDAEPCRP